MTRRHRGLHQHAHRDLGGVARRDRVHGVQVVVDEEPLGHRDLGEAGLHPDPHAVRSTRNTALAPSRLPKTAGCRRAARRGVSTSDMWWSGLPCRATLLWSKIGLGYSMARDLDEAPHLGHTVRVALSRDGAFLGLPGAGHTTSARTGASGPHLDRDDFPPRLSVRKGDTPDRGDRWTTDR